MSTFKDVVEQLHRQPKRWLVTGNAGFIGSNIVEFLLNNNQEVVGLDNFSTGYRRNIEDVLNNVGKRNALRFTFIEGDIADLDTCEQACQGIDVVLHQAALGSVPRSIEDPVTSNRSNITGFLNLLTAAQKAGIKRFVYASSSSVYGDSETLPKIEEHTGNLLSPYAVMKMANELYAGVFHRVYGTETIGLRYFNVFGRRQDPDGAYAAVIPKWIGQILRGEEVYINGDGETSRDFTYIDNVIQMNVLAATTTNKAAFGEAFNVAVGGRNTLNELYRLITDELKKHRPDLNISPVKYRDFRPGDIRHSNADITKAQKVMGYEPTHDIYRGMSEAIEWYIAHLES